MKPLDWPRATAEFAMCFASVRMTRNVVIALRTTSPIAVSPIGRAPLIAA
jgi:hypothetical protein